MNAFTVTVRRRLPFARVLAESFLANNPGSHFSALVIDAGASEIENQGFDVVRPEQIGVSGPDLSKLAMLYDRPRLTSALVPVYARWVLDSRGGPLLYFAFGCRVFAGLEALAEQASGAGILLARRVFSPLPLDGRTPGQEELFTAGLVDAGFMGLAGGSEEFLAWWSGASGSEAAVERATSGDGAGKADGPQPLTDLASLYPHRLTSAPGAGASFWNVHGRPIEASGNSDFTIAGHPLLFFHFEGFTPESAHLLSTSQGPRPRVLLSERPDLRLLTEMYERELVDAGFEEALKIAYGFHELGPGTKVDRRMRSIYRQALAATVDGAKPPPDPFDPAGPESFIDWLNSPDEAGRAPLVPRYLFALWLERLDLQSAFPGIAKADAGRFLDWVANHGAAEAGISAELAAPSRPHAKVAGQRPWRLEGSGEPIRRKLWLPSGLNLAGYLHAELGVGEMARLVLSGVEKSGTPYSTYSYRANMSRQSHPFEGPEGELPYDTTLICVNADELKPFFRDIGPELAAGRYAIGLCWWELEHFPASMASDFDLLDEVWVGSEHVAAAIRAVTDKPVYLAPIPMRLIHSPKIPRQDLGLPEGFTFLFTFDFLSVFERKNPVGVVEAFRKAFPEGDEPSLVIKSINGDKDLWSLEKLKVAAAGRSDIKIIDGYLPADEKDAFLAACDCYVSLHRAEGYGLGMAEAMALSKPVIATGYSGNLAFMTQENSYLAGYALSPVPPASGPYPEGAPWAAPNLEEAAALMRRVFENQRESAEIGARAGRDAASVHTPGRTAGFITARLEDIRQKRTKIQARDLAGRVAGALPRRLGFRRN